MSKLIFDPIHNYMEFEKELLQIIDTKEFQRLRNIKQLGLAYLVFSGASHNRFEHSLGVAYLSYKMIKGIQKRQPELQISDRTCILIKVAGLIHDLGHACFSHFFDDVLIPKLNLKNSKYSNHETRSGLIFEYMVEDYNLKFTKREINFIKELIHPTKTGFLYQIVSNQINGLDCDKFDYIVRDTYNIGLKYSFDYSRLIKQARVIDNNICFPDKEIFSIYDLYHTRYKLHKQIYSHPVIHALDLMVGDTLINSSEYFYFTSKLNNIRNFVFFTDTILDRISCIVNYKLKRSQDILKNIQNRKLYKLVGEKNVPINKNLFREFENKIAFTENKLNFSKGDKNPVEHILFYKLSEPDKCFNIYQNQISGLLPNNYQEKIYRIYCKDNKIYDDVKKIFNNI